MNKKIIIALVAVFTVLFSANIALAGSLSIASITIPSSTNQGDGFTLSASISGSDATSISGTLSLPSGITCSPTGSQSISLGSSNTGTTSWSCTGNVAGDYTNKITVSISGTDTSSSSSGGGLSGSQQTGLKILSPASLAASSTTKSGSVIFTIGVNNAGDLTTTYTVSTSCAGATACSAPSGTQSISGNAVKNHDVTVTGSAGTYTATATITAANGQTLTTSQSVTIPAAQAVEEAVAAAAAGGPTPGVKVTLQKGKATITIPSIAAAKSAVVVINKTEDVAFRQISIFVKNSVNNIQVTVTKLADKPAAITQTVTGNVYHYIEVNKTNITDVNINLTAIRFEVEKSWLTANNINKSTIALYRYSDNVWNKLQTTEMIEETTTVLYEAISPGLSVFAISGEVKAAAPTAEQLPTEEKPPEEKVLPVIPVKGKGGFLVTIVVIIAVIAGVVFYLMKKNVIKFGVISKKNQIGTT